MSVLTVTAAYGRLGDLLDDAPVDRARRMSSTRPRRRNSRRTFASAGIGGTGDGAAPGARRA